MPLHAPKLLEQVSPLLQTKLALAVANKGREVNVLVGCSKAEADSTLRKLRAMRSGLSLYQPEGSELRRLAEGNFIDFKKEYKPKEPHGKQHTVFMIVNSEETIRPSAIVGQNLAAALGYLPSSVK